MRKDEIIKYIEEGKLYELVGNKYHDLDKKTLADILLDTSYTFKQIHERYVRINDFYKELAKNLKDRWQIGENK